jgi:hypothetical protein
MPFSELLAGYGTTTLAEGMVPEYVFALLKLRAEDGSATWSVRSGGPRLPMEELLGVLDAITTSISQKLTKGWKGDTSPESSAGSSRQKGPPVHIPFAELFAGLETVGVVDEHLIESVFAIIKARRVDGASAWFVRSGEMTLSSEEVLGALDGYAATVRQDLAAGWKW